MHPIFFVHPPKSGGQTVGTFFRLNDLEYVDLSADYGCFEDLAPRHAQTGAGGGHLPYGVHSRLKRPLNYFTLLRDPLHRHISHYRYARAGESGAIHRFGTAPEEGRAYRGLIDIDEWVGRSLPDRNLFVRLLSGMHPTDRALAKAKENILTGRIFVGLTDDMSRFLLLLCNRTGLSKPFYFFMNCTEDLGEKYVPSEAAIVRFKALNRLDYELYEFVKAQNESMIAARSAILGPALSTVKAIQSKIDVLANPHEFKTADSGIDPSYLSAVKAIIDRSDLGPIDAYLEFEKAGQATPPEYFHGHVDAVKDGHVTGWAVNLSDATKPVRIEIRVESEVVAAGWNDLERPDVFEAGYGSARAGFVIPLPRDAEQGFCVTMRDFNRPNDQWRPLEVRLAQRNCALKRRRRPPWDNFLPVLSGTFSRAPADLFQNTAIRPKSRLHAVFFQHGIFLNDRIHSD